MNIIVKGKKRNEHSPIHPKLCRLANAYNVYIRVIGKFKQ
jgi:hypothetical protein